MRVKELDELFLRVKSKAIDFFLEVSQDIIVVDRRNEWADAESSYTRVFQLQKVVDRSVTGRLTFDTVGTFSIGEFVDYNYLDLKNFIPFISYNGQDSYITGKISEFLAGLESYLTENNPLEAKYKKHLALFKRGLSNQQYLITAVEQLNLKYGLLIENCHNSCEGHLFKLGVSMTDHMERSFVIYFQHEFPKNDKEMLSFVLMYNIFVFTEELGPGTEMGARGIVIEKKDYNLGLFEEKLVMDISP